MPKYINIKLLYQHESEWCWAACLEMILKSRWSDAPSQCELAGDAFDVEGCCRSPADRLCNRPLPVWRIAGELANYGIPYVFHESRVSEERLVEEVTRNRPVLLGLQFDWSDGGTSGHAVLVVGWDENQDGRFLIVHDPARGIGSDWYEDLSSAYGRGRWYCTWTGLGG
jgi:Papain-like cysteine protease AvrRpt2